MCCTREVDDGVGGHADRRSGQDRLCVSTGRIKFKPITSRKNSQPRGVTHISIGVHTGHKQIAEWDGASNELLKNMKACDQPLCSALAAFRHLAETAQLDRVTGAGTRVPLQKPV
eukprot:scpid98197/ scgid31844/ 